MAEINLQSYKVVSQELSSATKFNNLVQAIEDGLNLGSTDIQVANITFGTAGDTNLYRASANVLKTDDSFTAAVQITAVDDVTAQSGNAAEMRVGARGPTGQAGLQFGSALDTNLYRGAANMLETTDAFQIQRAGTGDQAFGAYVAGDSSLRYYVGAGGTVSWGPGNAVADTNLYRFSANNLKTDDSFYAAGSLVADHADGGGRLYFGSALDTSLYRSAADNLRTDDTFAAQNGIYGGYTGSVYNLNVSPTQVGFFGSIAAKQTVTGSRGSNAALASLLTALATAGLITDSSSA